MICPRIIFLGLIQVNQVFGITCNQFLSKNQEQLVWNHYLAEVGRFVNAVHQVVFKERRKQEGALPKTVGHSERGVESSCENVKWKACEKCALGGSMQRLSLSLSVREDEAAVRRPAAQCEREEAVLDMMGRGGKRVPVSGEPLANPVCPMPMHGSRKGESARKEGQGEAIELASTSRSEESVGMPEAYCGEQ